MATAAAYFGLECDINKGGVDIAKQAPNVARMTILGAHVIPATHGLRTLKEAVGAALLAYGEDPDHQIYCIGSVVGPYPFPMMVRSVWNRDSVGVSEVFANFASVGDEGMTFTRLDC